MRACHYSTIRGNVTEQARPVSPAKVLTTWTALVSGHMFSNPGAQLLRAGVLTHQLADPVQVVQEVLHRFPLAGRKNIHSSVWIEES